MAIARLAQQGIPTFLLALSLGAPASCQENRAADAAIAEPAAAVVQLLAIGPGQQGTNRECGATGFLINDEGYILTNAHVVEDARHCLAGAPGTKIVAKLARPGARAATAVSCDLVGLDDVRDLAVLRTERPLPTEGQLSFVQLNPGEVAEGTSVAVTGHPAFAWRPTTQKGKVIRRGALELCERSAEKSEVIILDIPLGRGASGSPVYLESGAAVGIVERQDPSHPSQTVAVPIRYAIELLDHLHVRWQAAPK
jgi:serine protease Do